MIFQSLISFYDRLDKAGEAPPFGFSIEDIGFVITIDVEGNLVGQPEDLRNKIKANTYDYRLSLVPYSNQVGVRAVNAVKTPNFMVDKADYIFGMSGKALKPKYHQNFLRLIDDVCGDCRDTGIKAVKRFLKKWEPANAPELEGWKEISGTHGKWVAFRLQGDSCFVHERSEVKDRWSSFVDKGKYHHPEGVCFVDGSNHKQQGQYAQFKFGSGSSLVSFNEKAYESYGKKRGENAPISIEAEFKSSAALKYLFRSKTQRLRIGDTTTIFWAERESPVETIFGQIINPFVENDAATIPVQKFLEAVRKGVLPSDLEGEKNLKFFILGLSVNKARLALRYWHVCSVGDLMKRLKDHFRNLEMEQSSEKDIIFPGIWHLLKETARETKDISPVLGGALTRSILTGTNYPQNLYQGVLGRIRVDRRVNYLRTSIIKAYLQRNHNMEVPMSLDQERKEVAYLLGRLFAVLERTQLDALGKINSTIKDRFFSAASATPASVFPRLLRLSQHHIEKSDFGNKSDRRIAEIMDDIDMFPAHMNLQDQGLFAIAYYQQKNAIIREIVEAAAKKKAEKLQGEEK